MQPNDGWSDDSDPRDAFGADDLREVGAGDADGVWDFEASADAIAGAGGVEPVAGPRFCRRCGTALLIDGACSWCAVADADATNRWLPATGSSEPLVSVDQMSLAPALWLYFVLLGTFAFAFFGDDSVSIENTISLVDSVIVLIWSATMWRRILPLLRPPGHVGWLLAPIAMGAATYLATSWFIGLFESMGVPMIDYTPDLLDAGYGVPFILLLIAVQPAVIEELAFRGIIFHALQRVLSVREAMIVSALMFSALHLSPLAMPHTFAIGMIAAWMVVRTGSLWPGVLLHFTHNAMCVVDEMWRS